MNNFPNYRGDLFYKCQECGAEFEGDELYYTCPRCKGVFLLENKEFSKLKEVSGQKWREIFDARLGTKLNVLRGIFRYYELIAPIFEPEDIVYLGEGNTPIIEANHNLKKLVGLKFFYKNDGQNPSASFKDRGMACAFSFLNYLVRKFEWSEILTICASTGDTSAAAAMYAAYVNKAIKSVVLLPQGKVTPQQLAQPLGSGALVIELPGVFDDCMKVVEFLADNYRVALLNSKNAWRILGQESYAYEIAQWFDWDVANKVIFVPIGNAGNITAIINGFLKLYQLQIIDSLPKIIGVQSRHADPVFRFYSQPKASRTYSPVQVEPSVAQAAMIGNPVSFPRVKNLVERYEKSGGTFHVVQVEEQEILDCMLIANRGGHIACTQGGECLAGLLRAKEKQLIVKDEEAILDATAHMLKFIGFQQMYFEENIPPSYEIVPKPELINKPVQVLDQTTKDRLDFAEFVQRAGNEIVSLLGISKR
ncbi:MAG: threonine synthase [Desulfonauticus sp.]|nr:threonine synthase [Desulfonauticus sp.]